MCVCVSDKRTDLGWRVCPRYGYISSTLVFGTGMHACACASHFTCGLRCEDKARRFDGHDCGAGHDAPAHPGERAHQDEEARRGDNVGRIVLERREAKGNQQRQEAEGTSINCEKGTRRRKRRKRKKNAFFHSVAQLRALFAVFSVRVE